MKNIVCLLLCFLFVGCTATGPKFSSIATPDSGKALVYVYRQAAFYGYGNCPDLIINKIEIGCLKNDGFLSVVLDAGTYPVKFQFGSASHPANIEAEITVNSDEIYFYEYGQNMTGLYLVGGIASSTGSQSFNRKSEQYSLNILKDLKESI